MMLRVLQVLLELWAAIFIIMMVTYCMLKQF